MHLTEYRKATLRTLPDLGSDKLNYAHMLIGMTSELEELQEALAKKDAINVSEEVTDWTWYGSNLANMFDLPVVVQYDVSTFSFNHLVNVTSAINGAVKKFIAYNKPVDKEELQKLLQYGFNVCANFYDSGIKVNLEEAMGRNIAKLKARFPEKFSDEKALNRDLDKEREVLEGKDGSN